MVQILHVSCSSCARVSDQCHSVSDVGIRFDKIYFRYLAIKPISRPTVKLSQWVNKKWIENRRSKCISSQAPSLSPSQLFF